LGGTKSKIRGVIDYTGKSIDQAGPSTPVELLGLEIVPAVGALLGDEKPAEVQKREVISLLQKLRNENSNILNVIAKADKVGSLEAIEDALLSFNVEGDVVKLVAKGTGDITEKDVELAAATKAFIVGFAVKVTPPAAKIADTEHVLIRTYNIIYELLDEIKDVVEGMLAGELSEEIFGIGQIVAEFQFGKNTRIAGVKVLDGQIAKAPKVRVVRENKDSGETLIIGEGKIRTIKHLKDEVAKIEQGQEGGIIFDSEIEFQVGDIIHSYRTL
jgi:translation initiation factor IF-2